MLAVSTADSREDIFDKWQERYPESQAGERRCQLCHQSDDGGDGWNRYGFDIRTLFFDVFGGIDIEATFATAEMFNSDNDDEDLTNLEEIQGGFDPGWVNGARNSVYFKDGRITRNIPPPFLADGVQSVEFCFVIPLSELKQAIPICL